MPIKVEIYPEHRLLRSVYTGKVSLADVSQSYQEFLATPGSHLVKYAINDLRFLNELQGFYDGANVMADLIASDGDAMADPWDIAIVTDNTGHLPLLLEYADRINSSSTVRCKVLPDIPEAMDWFGLDRNAFGPLQPTLIGEPQAG